MGLSRAWAESCMRGPAGCLATHLATTAGAVVTPAGRAAGDRGAAIALTAASAAHDQALVIVHGVAAAAGGRVAAARPVLAAARLPLPSSWRWRSLGCPAVVSVMVVAAEVS